MTNLPITPTAASSAPARPWTFITPSLKDPRVMLAGALTLWTVLGQTAFYFNRDLVQLSAALATACVLDFLLAAILHRQILVPLSAYITGLSIGILLESYDWRVFVLASAWGIVSKYLLHDRTRHFFNPSNFGIVAALLLCHGAASIAPGSQWGADYRIALLILALGLMMMRRVHRLDLALAWLAGYMFMGFIRMTAGQGGLVFALGPMTGAEFALFTFSMMPDPKTSPPTPRGRIAWGLSIAICDGILRYFEIRYSMFYSLFAHCAALPIIRLAAQRRGITEVDPWRLIRLTLSPTRAAPHVDPAAIDPAPSVALADGSTSTNLAT